MGLESFKEDMIYKNVVKIFYFCNVSNKVLERLEELKDQVILITKKDNEYLMSHPVLSNTLTRNCLTLSGLLKFFECKANKKYYAKKSIPLSLCDFAKGV